MKVILSMATTINGYIAGENNNTDWVSKEAWGNFTQLIQKAGCVIVGRKTFEAMLPDEFPMEGALNVVMSSRKIDNKWGENVVFTDKSSRLVLKMLEEKGFATVVVGGGGELNAAFMKDGLIDEISLDVEPLVFTGGTQLFNNSDFGANLKLLDVKKGGKNTLHLRYKVESSC